MSMYWRQYMFMTSDGQCEKRSSIFYFSGGASECDRKDNWIGHEPAMTGKVSVGRAAFNCSVELSGSRLRPFGLR